MMQKIYNALIHYLETNRLDNLNIRTSWRLRLQDIYVAHHQQKRSSVTEPSSLRRQHVEKK
jgi:hypothetical protein